MHWLTAVKLGYVVFFLALSAWAYTLIDPASVQPVAFVARPQNSTLTSSRGVSALLAHARQGDAAAEYRVGQLYAVGDRVPQSAATAARWYAKAAAQGDAKAQTSLGWAYYVGAGVAVDRAAAQHWLALAAAQGDASAKRRLRLVKRSLAPTDLAAVYSR